jgi:Family of unknown function (DUF6511)
MSGAKQVRDKSRQTYASVTPSSSARSVIDLACPLSILRRQRCARASALIRVSFEILTELGLMEHFFDLTAEQIDQLIEAAVDGFQQSMQGQALNDDLPF